MGKPTVLAVMQVVIEVPVRPSSASETFEQMHEAAKREAEGALRNRLPSDMRIVGPVTFSHATVKEL